MRYPLVATDFDDTLLRSDLTLSEYTKSVIKRYQAAGGTFMISTGRMYSSILRQAKRAGLDSGLVIAYQGAMICDMTSGKVLHHVALPPEAAVPILKELEREGLVLQVYIDDVLYVERMTDATRNYERVCEVEATMLDKKLSAYVKERGQPVTKILAVAHPQKVLQLYCDFPKVFGEELTYSISKPYFFEVAARGADKGIAVEFACRRMGITKSQVITFGDGINDVSMLEFADLSFAVSNASEPAKRAAKHICPSNDEDGVAKMIEKYCLSEI
ncbi:MAG: HAD family phosphatase [Clostridiales bacterium]|jgi:Cof subfamily protein (haloacid dehalogenase superfamily)|nr:HAD family phosphatase [Clostridiales bacterium]